MGTAALTRCGAKPLGSHLFAVWPGSSFAATALPVRCAPGDNLALHVAVAQAPPQSALVVDVSGEPEYGYVDEILAVAARMRRISGIVIDGCVRDVAAIARAGLPVVGAGVSVRTPGHDAGGAVGREVLLNDDRAPTPVRRGDWIVADDDGAVCLPRGRAAAIVSETVEAVAADQRIVDALIAGASTLDLLNLDPSRVAGWEGAGVAAARSAERAG
ncbi:RraA family protein [Streptomonospora sp. PA3]|uniref:RraA family protein n=1 Tax=Streptomonospora sp. PA3 TaxID=2607326 RepID=UPI0012DC4186|nr:RraA family protein [Streptomonospora sp. PA3]MUL44247.1 RraA family protein [Streptomonospora sp. PA3]